MKNSDDELNNINAEIPSTLYVPFSPSAARVSILKHDPKASQLFLQTLSRAAPESEAAGAFPRIPAFVDIYLITFPGHLISAREPPRFQTAPLSSGHGARLFDTPSVG
jgi:hypothetical protein